MPKLRATKLSLIRHAPAQDGGCLAGRRDVPAHPGDPMQITALRGLLGRPTHLISSPAKRCQQTSAMLWKAPSPRLDPQLWEQNFGTWEGTAYADLPDIGALPTHDLAAHRPPEGESFNDLCARISARLTDLQRDAKADHITVVCHAGVIRAALAWAAGLGPSALGFTIDNLSLTQIELSQAGHRITRVNWLTP